MTTMPPGPRSARIAITLGAMLVTASCVGVPGPAPNARASFPERFDGGVGQLVHYCATLRAAGNLATAAGVCERAHRLDPTNPEPLLMLADIFLDNGETEQAAQAYRALLDADPEHAEARYRLGKTYIALRQYDLALGEFRAALRKRPEDPRLYNAMGIANGMLGAHASAQAAFQAGLDIAPDDVSLRNNMGLSLVLAGRHDEGLALLEVIAADPAAKQISYDNLQVARGLAVAAETDAVLALAEQHDDTVTVDNDAQYSLPAGTDADDAPGPAPMVASPSGATVAQVESQPVEERALGAPTPITGPMLVPRPTDQWATTAVTDGVTVAPSDQVATPKPAPAAPAAATRAERTAHLGRADQESIRLPLGAANGDYAIQFASFRSEDAAELAWDKISAKAPELLAAIEPVVQRVDLGPDRGIFFRLRTAPLAKETADGLCGVLRSGAVECLVVKIDPEIALAPDDGANDLPGAARDVVEEAATGAPDDVAEESAEETSEDETEETPEDVAEFIPEDGAQDGAEDTTRDGRVEDIGQ